MSHVYTVCTESDETHARLLDLAQRGGYASVDEWLSGMVRQVVAADHIDSRQAEVREEAAALAETVAAPAEPTADNVVPAPPAVEEEAVLDAPAADQALAEAILPPAELKA